MGVVCVICTRVYNVHVCIHIYTARRIHTQQSSPHFLSRTILSANTACV